MTNEHKKINSEIEIIQKYVGIKNEVSSQNENRNYLYHINSCSEMWKYVVCINTYRLLEVYKYTS